MVLYSNNLSTSSLSSSQDCILIKRFDGEWIYHTDVDAFSFQEFGSFHGLVKGDTCTNNGHLVIVTLVHNLSKKGEKKHLRIDPGM